MKLCQVFVKLLPLLYWLLGSFKNDKDDSNSNVIKAIGIRTYYPNSNFARATRFLYISLPSLHDYDLKLPNFTFSGGRELQTTIF